LQFDRERLKWADEKRKLQGQLRELIRVNDELEEKVSIDKHLSSVKRARPFSLRKSSGKSIATPGLNYSDWHCEEHVRPETICGKNEFNLEICKTRVEACVQRSILLLSDAQNLAVFDRIFLGLGGDFITGYLRPENEQTNLLTPILASEYALELLANSIETIHLAFPKHHIHIGCVTGNHSRISEKTQHANRVHMSHEFSIYRNIARVFKKNSKIEVQICEGEVNELQFGDHLIRQSHGDEIKSAGGIGGLYPSILKRILKRNQFRRASYNIFHDKHQMIPGDEFCVNGSLIGYNTFAEHIGAEWEPPCQSMFLCDHKRGVVWTKPIFCD
jgi:hypothetical protein